MRLMKHPLSVSWHGLSLQLDLDGVHKGAGDMGFDAGRLTLLLEDELRTSTPVRVQFIAYGPVGSTLRVNGPGVEREVTMSPEGLAFDLVVQMDEPTAEIVIETDAAPGEAWIGPVDVADAAILPLLDEIDDAMAAVMGVPVGAR